MKLTLLMSSWNVCTKVASVNGAGMKFSAVLACAAAPQSVRLGDTCTCSHVKREQPSWAAAASLSLETV